ncbi:uncharacterized protein CMU_002610 [Cryptosporidium muris RN66]|uniref:Uncharacterized protein n=1 Tax=Cryptosporidium muris (strain RN66) TaxID=441375 RepID=B6AJP2_CRYMR|nr:uncharacterized protein CMU_002610 [Cryptosporidium muris RN66]EEA08433.1 hypothetical protein, conserved [Cryptosporidium muris RN66]|eukprot:XP_002142782.1 hypothetical protein [Cryptosporidium muris RN66]
MDKVLTGYNSDEDINDTIDTNIKIESIEPKEILNHKYNNDAIYNIESRDEAINNNKYENNLFLNININSEKNCNKTKKTKKVSKKNKHMIHFMEADLRDNIKCIKQQDLYTTSATKNLKDESNNRQTRNSFVWRPNINQKRKHQITWLLHEANELKKTRDQINP